MAFMQASSCIVAPGTPGVFSSMGNMSRAKAVHKPVRKWKPGLLGSALVARQPPCALPSANIAQLVRHTGIINGSATLSWSEYPVVLPSSVFQLFYRRRRRSRLPCMAIPRRALLPVWLAWASTISSVRQRRERRCCTCLPHHNSPMSTAAPTHPATASNKLPH